MHSLPLSPDQGRKFYDHPALKFYKWYWRVEPDVQFTCAIT